MTYGHINQCSEHRRARHRTFGFFAGFTSSLRFRYSATSIVRLTNFRTTPSLTRYIFVPVMVLSGLWMWKGHVVRPTDFEEIDQQNSALESRQQNYDKHELFQKNNVKNYSEH